MTFLPVIKEKIKQIIPLLPNRLRILLLDTYRNIGNRSKTSKPYKHVLFNAREYLDERCANRKLIIYGVCPESKKLSRQLKKNNFLIQYYADDTNTNSIFMGKAVKPPEAIKNEQRDGIFIIVVCKKEDYGTPRQNLIQLGLEEDVHFTYYAGVLTYGVPFYYDVTLSYNRKKEELLGFEIFGDRDNNDALKIALLGNSTSESMTNFIPGYAHNLYKIFAEKNIPVTIYCGGTGGYTSTQELLKLIRDVLPLRPDIITSVSGFNDLQDSYITEEDGFPFITDFQKRFSERVISRHLTERLVYYGLRSNKKYAKTKHTIYYGLQNYKKASEIWVDNARMMHAISREFNILFFSFLQPFYYAGDYTPDEIQSVVFRRRWGVIDDIDGFHIQKIRDKMIEGAGDIRKRIKNTDYITDLTNIFNDRHHIYRDCCHVTEQGNQIIAENIYSKIAPHLDFRSDR